DLLDRDGAGGGPHSACLGNDQRQGRATLGTHDWYPANLAGDSGCGTVAVLERLAGLWLKRCPAIEERGLGAPFVFLSITAPGRRPGSGIPVPHAGWRRGPPAGSAGDPSPRWQAGWTLATRLPESVAGPRRWP